MSAATAEPLPAVPQLASAYGLPHESVREVARHLGFAPVRVAWHVAFFAPDDALRLINELDKTRPTSGR